MVGNNRFVLIKRLSSRRRRVKGILQSPVLESVSIGDMAFLLLIFFIVTSSFVLRQGIFFSLPSKSGGAVKVDTAQILDVYPLNSGFRINEAILSRDDALKTVKEHKKRVKDGVMIIHMESGVIYDRFVDTLSLAKEAGLRRVSLRENIKE